MNTKIKMMCLMLLLASNVIGQPVLLVPGAQTTALSTKQVQTVHVTGDVASLVQKRMTVSAEEIRWLKVFTKKDDLVQRIKNNESKLASELRLLFAAKQPAVLAVVAENEFDSVVIQLSVDTKGAHEAVVYSAAECPAWVAPLVDASAQATDASWSLAKKLGVTGLVTALVGGISTALYVGVNILRDFSLDTRDFFGLGTEEQRKERQERQERQRAEEARLAAEEAIPVITSVADFEANKTQDELFVYVNGNRFRLTKHKTYKNAFAVNTLEWRPIIAFIHQKYSASLAGKNLAQENMAPARLVLNESRILFAFRLPGYGSYDVTNLFFPTEPEKIEYFSYPNDQEAAAIEDLRRVEEKRQRAAEEAAEKRRAEEARLAAEIEARQAKLRAEREARRARLRAEIEARRARLRAEEAEGKVCSKCTYVNEPSAQTCTLCRASLPVVVPFLSQLRTAIEGLKTSSCTVQYEGEAVATTLKYKDLGFERANFGQLAELMNQGQAALNTLADVRFTVPYSELNQIAGNLYLGTWQFTRDYWLAQDEAALAGVPGKYGLTQKPAVVLFVGNLDQRIGNEANCHVCACLMEGHPVDWPCGQEHRDMIELRNLWRAAKVAPEQGDQNPFCAEFKKDGVTFIYCPFLESSNATEDQFVSRFLPEKDRVFELMTNALDLGRPVIIHCIDGVNRSLAITVAYLFEQAKLSGIEGRNDSRVMCDMISLCASKRKGVKTINSLKELSQENIQYYGMTLRSVVEYYLGCSWGSKAPSPALALAAASALRFEGTPGCGAGGAIHPAAGVGRRSEVSAVDPTAEVVPDYLADINTKIKNFTAPGFEEISDEKLREMIERGDWSNLKSKMATHVGYDISMYLPFADMGSGLFLGNDNATTKIFEEKRKLTTIEINRLNEQMWLTGSEDGVALIGHPGFDSLPGALSDGTNFDLILCVAAYTSERATDIALIRNTFRSYGKFNGSGGKEFDIFTGRNAQRFIYCPCDEKDDISNFHTQFLPYSEKIFASMDATLSSGGQVLVHCMGGQHRSATALFSYIKTRLPHLNCWRIINYMRHVRDVVKDPHDALKGNRKSNMLNSAIRYFVGTPCAWVSE